jgi:bifunctional DNA-binding transcriptional regulator/antitoxin component of YhaV-PrlF toxin-antitoxin module
MNSQTIAKVTPEHQINFPPELQEKLNPGDEYNVVVTETSLILERVIKPSINLDEFLEELDNLEPDSEQPTLEEISAIVKQVRQERSFC